MRRKLEFGLLAGLILAALAFVILDGPAPAPPETKPTVSANPRPDLEETTIRNVTKETVSYDIRPFMGAASEVRRQSLAPGAIDRVETKGSFEIRFPYGTTEVAFTLDPGKAYSFRYDEAGIVQIYLGSHGRPDAVDLAPFVPTPMPVVEKMLELAAVTPEDIVYDLGCGDGRIVIAAAKKYGARGVGIDIDDKLVIWASIKALLEGVDHLVRFKAMDVTRADFSEATVVALYLIPESNALLEPLFEKQLKPGARVVSHNYTMPGWKGTEVQAVSMEDEKGEEHHIYVYKR